MAREVEGMTESRIPSENVGAKLISEEFLVDLEEPYKRTADPNHFSAAYLSERNAGKLGEYVDPDSHKIAHETLKGIIALVMGNTVAPASLDRECVTSGKVASKGLDPLHVLEGLGQAGGWGIIGFERR